MLPNFTKSKTQVKMQQVTINIEPEHKKLIEEASKKIGLSFSSYVRQAVLLKIKREGDPQ